jgi:F-type H+-transporting ATPase subunit gamma
MANIKDLKMRIKSTKGTLKITSAMKLVSAAKLAKAQAKIQGLKPYSNQLDNTIRTVSALATDYSHDFLTERPDNNKAIVLLISADKGLCGGYNSQLAKAVKNYFSKSNVDPKFFYIGKKSRDLIKKDVNSGTTYTFVKLEPTLDEIRSIANELSQIFTSGEVGKVFVAYNSFVSALEFNSTIKQILPISQTEDEVSKLQKDFPFDFKYEPAPENILDTLIPEVFVSSLYTAQLDAVAAEHGSRMNSMENASKNSKEMVDTLTLKMNKLRQAAITTELIEVVSGAESLNS